MFFRVFLTESDFMIDEEEKVSLKYQKTYHGYQSNNCNSEANSQHSFVNCMFRVYQRIRLLTKSSVWRLVVYSMKWIKIKMEE